MLTLSSPENSLLVEGIPKEARDTLMVRMVREKKKKVKDEGEEEGVVEKVKAERTRKKNLGQVCHLAGK